ncbi:MerR family transcriptional regulator [Paralimibaculum aggregatum]|uniref:MerR family transcriptional regulator n=1 Tax=Paralimibaculum aggregatum TaxID=3036245 RepID=A0ABQ6LHS5_9RHOB|nr:MerR family transcriptional regulator [Limibaculum sp. NKW23]GMG81684.1 MerR family transcriptional regulator [Limibaculum sp. NKW23]
MATPPARGRPAGGKSAEAFRTISEVADDLGVPQHVLRFWETRFVQVKPMKRNGGRRLYRPDHVALLRGIKALLYDDGLTIKGAQKILREQGTKAVVARGRLEAGEVPAPGLPEDAPERLAALKARLGAAVPTLKAEAAMADDDGETGETGAERGRAPARPALSEEDRARVQGSIRRLQAILEQLESR